MLRDPVIMRELQNIKTSVEEIGIKIYSKMLQCPNLNSVKEELTKISATGDYRLISDWVTEKCFNFICDKKAQMFDCNNGECKYRRKLESDLNHLHIKFKEIIEGLLV